MMFLEDLKVEIKGEKKSAKLGFSGFLVTLLVFFVLVGASTSYISSAVLSFDLNPGESGKVQSI